MTLDNLARPLMNFKEPFEWSGGKTWRFAEYTKQKGVVFRWDEAQLQYVPVVGIVPVLEWKAP